MTKTITSTFQDSSFEFSSSRLWINIMGSITYEWIYSLKNIKQICLNKQSIYLYKYFLKYSFRHTFELQPSLVMVTHAALYRSSLILAIKVLSNFGSSFFRMVTVVGNTYRLSKAWRRSLKPGWRTIEIGCKPLTRNKTTFSSSSLFFWN